jgi:hypothetical protein
LTTIEELQKRKKQKDITYDERNKVENFFLAHEVRK